MIARSSPTAPAYDRWGLRPRRLVDVSRSDTSVTLFGETWSSPIALSPVSSQRAFHADGERASALAAGKRNALQILSTLTTYSVEDVMKAHGHPVWQQLYTTNIPRLGEQVVARAEAAGASAIVFTIDLLGGGQRRETQAIFARTDSRTCSTCHTPRTGYDFSRKRMFDGLDMTGALTPNSNALTWDYVSRLRDLVKTRLLVKGVMTPEDANLAIKRGVDGIIISNHGGRAEDSLVGTLDVLPEIAQVGERPRADPDRWRHPARLGCVQGAGARRQHGLHRPALLLGPRRVWRGRRDGGAAPAGRGTDRHHAPVRRHQHCRDQERPADEADVS